jgi:hypothetical protein
MQGPNSSITQIQFPIATSVAFDLQAFLDAIIAHGLRFVHYRALRNPVGLIDRDDTRRPNPDTPLANNGMIYIKAGVVTALCISNTKEVKASDGGVVDSSTAQFTPLSHYECNGKQVFLAPFDKLYLEEESVLVSRQELIESSVTGVDRPKFPAVEILDCVDANGISYTQNIDFELDKNSLIHWLDKRPGQNIDSGKGIIYSIRYVYRPHWYVRRLIHEIRMIQQENVYTGEKTTVQAPQSAIIDREYYFESEASDSNTRASVEKPADGQITAN